ncbi:branched-chain amino acid ABC transporter permease [Paenibacillus thiaminolyticus]|uniref:branched-chain amino acid ABC transporter permease n=1 Tax=Paenibacillus thiaminolyticus TaxID=49283 RepID=UPI00116536A4|nr:branched-chain amino acid ABC transporter permease [Paenibacillus thiaminolyticus]NGP57949.1 branched-chain amino acid ABC transporter permease [Paenibacillus thiaminolyticus]WCR26901.1 branched-chain amino acid ABC transporter permease [Paenibacillus thiaminolyticus]
MIKSGTGNVYNRSVTGIAVVALLLAIIPLFSPSAYILSTLVIIGLYSLVGTGLGMLMGYAGQISLSHAAFYGVGAYSSAFVTVKLGMPPLAGMAVGILLAALIAYIVGIPTLRLTGHYLALATLGFGMIMFALFKQLKGITGGLDGFLNIPSLSLFGLMIDTDVQYYYVVWCLALLGILAARNMIHSRVGRALRSIESSEIASASIGIDTQKYKLQVFVMSAVFASIAGSVYAHYISFINPMLFHSNASIQFLIMSVLGGGTSIWGGFVGALAYVTLGEALKDIVPFFLPNVSDEFNIIFFGMLLVGILIYLPDGLAPVIGKMMRKLRPAAKKQAGRDHLAGCSGGENGHGSASAPSSDV